MTPRPTPKSLGIGSVLPVAAILLAGTTVTLATLSSFGVLRGSAAATLEAPTAVEVQATLARIGITGESLTAAGCIENDATEVGRDAVAYLDAAKWAALQTADDAARDATAETERLGKLVRAGQASQQDLAGYETAKATQTTTAASRDALLDALFDAASANLTQGEVGFLETIQANGPRTVPVQYKVVSRTDAEWTSLRDALANLRICERVGEDPDRTCSTLVAQTNAESQVAAARSHLDQRLSAVKTAFDQAIQR